MGDWYLPALSLLNLVLLVASTACLYLGSILVNIYLLPSLDLVSTQFSTVPYLIIAIGVLLLLISIFGVLAAVGRSRPCLVIYAILMAILVILQLAAVFAAMELRNEIDRKVLFQTVRYLNG